MRAIHLVAIGGVGFSSACGSADSRALFSDVANGGAASTTAAGAGGSADSVPLGAPVGGASAAGKGPGAAGGSQSVAGEAGDAGLPGEGGGGQPASTDASGTCAETCVNGSCTMTGAAVACACHSGFVSEGLSCRRPKSCAELYGADPTLPNGAYSLQPVVGKEPFQSYCLMTAEGGGWTLVLNHGTEFEPSAMGSGSQLAYEGKGTNLAYSSVVLGSDIMLDVRMDSIASETYAARAVIRGVHAETRGRTMRELFTSGPHYLEAEDNSNLSLTSSLECNFSPVDLGPLLCESPVLVLGNLDSSCHPDAIRFAISGAGSFSQPWGSCAGWPQATFVGGQQHFPNNFRVWIR